MPHGEIQHSSVWFRFGMMVTVHIFTIYNVALLEWACCNFSLLTDLICDQCLILWAYLWYIMPGNDSERDVNVMFSKRFSNYWYCTSLYSLKHDMRTRLSMVFIWPLDVCFFFFVSFTCYYVFHFHLLSDMECVS